MVLKDVDVGCVKLQFFFFYFCVLPLRNPSQILFPSKSHSYKPGFLVRCHIVLALNLIEHNGGREEIPR